MVQSKLTYGPIEKDEAESLWEIIYQSLHRHAQPGWNEHVGHESFRAVKSESKILGGMGIIDMGQWFGGKIVRTGAVTSVGVAPEGRGVEAGLVVGGWAGSCWWLGWWLVKYFSFVHFHV